MRTNRAAHATSKTAYPGTLAMLGLALAFPAALMIFNPTLMFERGWEQYVGTAIYAWAVLALGNEIFRLWSNEKAFDSAPAGLADPATIAADDRRILSMRLRQLGVAKGAPSQRMELNREASGLDQEAAGGRFTLTRYIPLYLLPVIGFIGTVEGISKALMNISRVLPMVKDLDDFMANLTSVTSALQIAFDSTLLALFLSAALMLVQTLVIRRSEDLLARVDRWVVDHVLSADAHVAVPVEAAYADKLEAIHRDLSALAEKRSATASGATSIDSPCRSRPYLAAQTRSARWARSCAGWRDRPIPSGRASPLSAGSRPSWRRRAHPTISST